MQIRIDRGANDPLIITIEPGQAIRNLRDWSRFAHFAGRAIEDHPTPEGRYEAHTIYVDVLRTGRISAANVDRVRTLAKESA